MSLIEGGNSFAGQNNPQHGSSSSEDTEPKQEDKTYEAPENSVEWAWEDDPKNPYNWPTKLKVRQVIMMASAGFTTFVPHHQPPVKANLTNAIVQDRRRINTNSCPYPVYAGVWGG